MSYKKFLAFKVMIWFIQNENSNETNQTNQFFKLSKNNCYLILLAINCYLTTTKFLYSYIAFEGNKKTFLE